MKTLILPVLALFLVAATAPVASAGCPWSKSTGEKPEEKVENPSA